jgi:hypothetical protein
MYMATTACPAYSCPMSYIYGTACYFTDYFNVPQSLSQDKTTIPRRKGSDTRSKNPNVYISVRCIALSFPSFSMHCLSSHTFIINNTLFIYFNNPFLSGDNFHSLLKANIQLFIRSEFIISILNKFCHCWIFTLILGVNYLNFNYEGCSIKWS